MMATSCDECRQAIRYGGEMWKCKRTGQVVGAGWVCAYPDEEWQPEESPEDHEDTARVARFRVRAS